MYDETCCGLPRNDSRPPYSLADGDTTIAKRRFHSVFRHTVLPPSPSTTQDILFGDCVDHHAAGRPNLPGEASGEINAL